jgi:hypothetical protein
MRTVLAVACVLVFLGVATPASAAGCPAPYAYPFQIGCQQGTCQEYANVYVCSGSLDNSWTCGGPCTGSITCCGQVVSYNPIYCDQLCAGCKPPDRKLAEGKVPQTGGASEIAAALADLLGNASTVKAEVTKTNKATPGETAATGTTRAAPAKTVATLVGPSGGSSGGDR